MNKFPSSERNRRSYNNSGSARRSNIHNRGKTQNNGEQRFSRSHTKNISNKRTDYSYRTNCSAGSNSNYCSGTKQDLFFLFCISTAILILCVTIFVSLVSNCNSNASVPNDNDLSANAKPSALLSETADMGKEYIDSMIFVGDSNTAHLVGFGILNGGKNTHQVWVPQGSTITLDSEITNKTILYPETNEYLTISKAAEKKKPEYLVISLGTNGISYLSEEQFKYCYKKLIDAIKTSSPNTKIIVQSIYPVTSWYTKISNEKIDLANTWLLSLAEECNVKYADTASVLKDSKGFMKEEYNSSHKDGYHINKDAAEKILIYLRTHGYNE